MYGKCKIFNGNDFLTHSVTLDTVGLQLYCRVYIESIFYMNGPNTVISKTDSPKPVGF